MHRSDPSPEPLSKLSAETLRGVRFLLTDVDGTLTSPDRLLADTYVAIERAHNHGLVIIPVTGRPGGWCDLMARQWPVNAVIGENGGMAILKVGRRFERLYWKGEADRRRDQRQIIELVEALEMTESGARIASDQVFREVDVAIDHSEEVTPLPRELVDRYVAELNARDVSAQASSIHINAWIGDFDKLKMSQRVMRDGFGCEWEATKDQMIYVGDAPNDAPLFAGIKLSVGVANILPQIERLTAKPAYVTTGAGGTGFIELVDRLLAARLS